jgi:predicted small lipoprotein YifL
MAPGCTTTQGNEMKRFQWLAVTAGIVALAACKGGDEVNMTNVEVNAADENLVLPPADTNVDVNAAVNVDTNADTNATDNATNNTADNTTNAY